LQPPPRWIESCLTRHELFLGSSPIASTRWKRTIQETNKGPPRFHQHPHYSVAVIIWWNTLEVSRPANPPPERIKWKG
jgi:hypothetical protein